MAKFVSIFRLKGTLENMTFVHGENGEVTVRRKSSLDRSRIANDPTFIRTRENGMEFGHIAQMGRLLRRTVVDVLAYAKDKRLNNRMMRVLSQIKNLDVVSPRGERKVWIGLETEVGRNLLQGFDFNGHAPLSTVVLKNPTLDFDTSTVSLAQFRPNKHLSIPQGATHAGLRMGVSLIRFEEDTFETFYSDETVFEINDEVQDFVLTPESVPTDEGRLLYFFMVSFYQEINQTQYPLRNGVYNALSVIAVL